MDTTKLALYRRGFSTNPETLPQFVMDEFQKLERQAETYYDAFLQVSKELKALTDRVEALEP